ncbi:LamG-like jellyroll fold domain-containing protein [Mucilaginibacter sp. FT3.2]|uniref:LamG-like jellyroll fold domain-containing protein n=1 Tax=Mucilaginibacter sp. FT3.2 TaxID=2723090 RepID=UPI001619D54A|nr:LamG-like jellyroll fold domain-containing protein [Mucilaginibacter sp. FT3.2]MBB6229845.1 hypothetical protein [Mucilaginibacter sp. FT3.2]
MKTYTCKQLVKNLVTVAVVALSATMLFTCNKDFQNKLKDASKNDTLGINVKTRKVLYIIVDGVRGRALRSLNAPNISKIVKNAIYAYDGLSDYGTNTVTNAGSWANMITGVTADKHKVESEDFAGNDLAAYPTLFARLKQANANYRTVSIASTGSFNTNLAKDATFQKTFEGDDAAVKTAVNTELQNEDAKLVVAQFHGAELAGETSSFEDADANYTDAILKIDGYVGEIMTALSTRKTFAAENWLVVIASNKGGAIQPDPTSTDFTSYGDDTRNNFVVFYNPRFTTLFVPKPQTDNIAYTNTSITYDYSASKRPNATIQDPAQYNIGVYGNFTVQVLIKSLPGGYYYPSFLSKRVTAFTGAGWNMFLEGDAWTLNSSVASQAQGTTISDGLWHKLTAVFDGTNRKVRVYTDGVLNTERAMNGNNPNNNASFKLGYIPGSEDESATVLLNNLQVYNVALTTQQIAAYACKTSIDDSNPNYKDLVGYWPMEEGAGNVLKDKSGKGSDLLVGSNGNWTNFSDLSPALCPDINASFFRLVPNDVDLPFEIYQWMSVTVPTAWNLDGKSWTPVYSDIKP